MNWNDAKEFTWEETKSLQWDELKLRAEELLEKLRNDNRMLPLTAAEELQKLCAQLPEDAPKIKKRLTFSETCVFISLLITYLEKLPEISQKYSPIFEKIIETVVKLFC